MLFYGNGHVISLEVCPSCEDYTDDVSDQCRDIIKRLQYVNPTVNEVCTCVCVSVYNSVRQYVCLYDIAYVCVFVCVIVYVSVSACLYVTSLCLYVSLCMSQ